MDYNWAGWRAKVPPTEIQGIPKVAGKLFLSGLDHAVSDAWLRWSGITTVVCCLGMKGAGGIPLPEWDAAHRITWPVRRMDWNPNNSRDQCQFIEVFAAWAVVLANPLTKMLVHCKSGKDRSPFAVYAFMRLSAGMTNTDAMYALAARVDVHGQQLCDIEHNHSWRWLSEALDTYGGAPLPQPHFAANWTTTT